MTTSQEKIQQGAIGFFDILGYQSILENNKTEDELNNAVVNILETISRIKNTDLPKAQFAFVGKSTEDNFPSDANQLIKRLVFSDTVILSLDFRDVNNDINDMLLWITFLRSCETLYNHMFKEGLPLRGAISFGQYIIHENSFVGIPIVEAYKLSEKLDLSACILTNDAAEKVRNSGLCQNALNEHFIEYLVPTKEGDKKFFTLNANPCDPEKDIREQVLSSFWKHNKDIPISVKNSKVENTLQWLTYLKIKAGEEK